VESLFHANPAHTDQGVTPRVILTSAAWTKIKTWTRLAADVGTEISGIGSLTRQGNIFRVQQVLVLKPTKVNGAYVEIDPIHASQQIQRHVMGKQYDQYAPILEGQRVPSNDELTELQALLKKTQSYRFWWHSHVKMQVFWSGTDRDNATNITNSPTAPVISLVTNVYDHALVRLDHQSKTVDRIPLLIAVDGSATHRQAKANYQAVMGDQELFYRTGPTPQQIQQPDSEDDEFDEEDEEAEEAEEEKPLVEVLGSQPNPRPYPPQPHPFRRSVIVENKPLDTTDLFRKPS